MVSCFGKVLDVGAGVGPHSLALQTMGLDVYAIDISTEACEIMKKRGLKNVLCSNVYGLRENNFDTILLMGRAIGFVGDLAGMAKFLRHCDTILSSNGIILLNSLDVRITSEPAHLDYQKKKKNGGDISVLLDYSSSITGSLGNNLNFCT